MPRGIEPEYQKCEAKRRDGQPCTHWAIRGRKVCRMHGGASPAPGPNHPAWKHGRYSTVVPRGIKNLYHMGRNDPNILEMLDELAILDARAAELLARVASGESEERWNQAREALRVVLSFQAQDDTENTVEAIGELSKIMFAANDYEPWRELQAIVDLRRKVANTERSRLVAAHQTVTVAQLLAFVASVSSIIVGRVTDPVLRSQIAEDIRRLISREGYGSETQVAVS